MDLASIPDGRSLAPEWTPVRMTAADEDDKSAELGDYALFGTIPVFNATAVDALLELPQPNAELLPLRYARREYMACNVSRFVDALDERRSKHDTTAAAAVRVRR